jgi:hypothetical protein
MNQYRRVKDNDGNWVVDNDGNQVVVLTPRQSIPEPTKTPIQTRQPLYEFQIADKDGNLLATLDGATERFFTFYLNKPGEAHFSLPVTDPKLTADLLMPGQKELKIRRAGSLVWGGEIITTRATLDTDSEVIEVTAKGYLDLLSHRVVGTTPGVPVSYPDSWDLSDIAHDLIEQTQTLTYGDLGITSGLTPVSRPAERTYDMKNLYEDALMGLSNNNVQNGIDFEITPDKTFNTYYPYKGRELTNVVFDWGVNIMSFTELRSAAEMANQVIALGAGEGEDTLIAIEDASADIQEEYRLRQKILSHKDVSISDTLVEHALNHLSLNALQSQVISLKTKGNVFPGYGAYEVGDFVRVRVARGLIAVDGVYRIQGIEVKVGQGDAEDITLVLSSTNSMGRVNFLSDFKELDRRVRALETV